MKLDFETLQSITFGAVRTWKTENGNVGYARVTENEEEGWRAVRDVLGNRAKAAAGIRFDFHTDADSFTLSLPRGHKVDVWFNDVLCHQLLFDDLKKEGKEPTVTVPIRGPLGEKYDECRVTLWLSAHWICEVAYLALDGATFVRPHEYKHKLLFLGDSIAHGWNGVNDSMGYTSRIARFFDADCVLAAVGGGIFAPTTIEDNGFNPDAILIAYGTNDFTGRPSFESLCQNCDEYLDKIKAIYPGRPVFVVTPTFRKDNQPRNAGGFAEVRQAITERAEARGFYVIDGGKILPPSDLYFAGDGVHPNDLGFAEMALHVIPAMKDVLGW